MKYVSLFLVAVTVFCKTQADVKIAGDVKNLISGKGFKRSKFDQSNLESLETVIENKSTSIKTTKVGYGKEKENDCCQKCEEKFGKDIKLLYAFTSNWSGATCNCYQLKDGVTTVKPSRSYYGSSYTGACGDLVIAGLGEKTALYSNSDVEALRYTYQATRDYVGTMRARPGQDKCCQKCQETFAEELNGVSPVYELKYSSRCYCKKPKSQNTTILTLKSSRDYAGFCDADAKIVKDCAEHSVYRTEDDFKMPRTTEASWSKCGKNCQAKTIGSWIECGKECQKLGEESCKTWVFSEGRRRSSRRSRRSKGKCIAYSKKAEDLKQESGRFYSIFTSGNSTCP